MQLDPITSDFGQIRSEFCSNGDALPQRLGTQMRRGAVSITNNIAEGHGRWHYQENIRFCRISRGSVDELIDDINTCQDEGYGDRALAVELKTEAYDLIRRINSYIAYLRKTKQGGEEC